MFFYFWRSKNNSAGFTNGTSGTSNDYTYDANGNMISDKNKNITSIEYNHLNLPTKIKWNNSETKKIEYLYNASGVKLRKKVTNGTRITTTDYIDGFQYVNGVLQFFPTAEGYVKNTVVNGQNTYDYVYNYTDHLDERKQSIALVEVCERSSIRMSYTKDPQTGDLKILEETEARGSRTPKKRRSHKINNSEQNHTATLASFDLEILNFQNLICPFGLKHKTYANIGLKMIEAINNETEKALVNIGLVENDVTATLYRYKYQGQERQDELGLNWDSFKWRNYDYAIGRFMSIDPLAEQYAYNSTYAFQENKMGMGRELEGLELVEWAKDKAQKIKETVNETVEQGKEWVKNNVVIEAEAKVTVGGQAGLKTGFGKVEAGFATTELGKVGVSTEKGTYAVKGDGKGHNFVGANVKALDKKLSVGAKVDYVTNDVAPPDGSDLVEYYPIQWGVNLGPEGSIGPGVKGDYDFLSTDTNIGTNSDCKCIDLGVGIKAVFGVDVNVRIGIKR